ncbi:uncharacterized protein LOC143177380 [Calliopsis andreniformis]|uniref:uncharacterized protein LOC143177380 n=1 Tax=Calliopsis andreniformis TaxID=337506 RepID=UPI003FCE760E
MLLSHLIRFNESLLLHRCRKGSLKPPSQRLYSYLITRQFKRRDILSSTDRKAKLKTFFDIFAGNLTCFGVTRATSMYRYGHVWTTYQKYLKAISSIMIAIRITNL